ARLGPEIQCVLVDLSLPDATGLEALEHVIHLAPHAAVLVLTGLRDAHVGVAAVQAGAQDYLVKQDVDARLLARAIRYAMERKRADLAQRRLVEAELTAKENARLENGLLPVPLLRNRGLRHSTRYLPGSGGRLAGDFLDTVQTPDGSIHVVVGDVCRHGPDEAALWVATVARGLGGWQRRGVGHPPRVLVRDGHVRLVESAPAGPPLGIFPDAQWTVLDVTLGERWSMMLYTDGLIEAAVGGEMLGVDGLVDLVRLHGTIDIDRLIGDVGTLNDDLAAVVVGRGET